MKKDEYFINDYNTLIKSSIWDSSKDVPTEYLKTISGGRLKGFTDINPIWRIKKASEIFGACGIGWKYEIIDIYKDIANSGEISLNIRINLFIKNGDEWSAAIPAIGGAMIVSNEKNGVYLNDEAYKMALTDAQSVAFKMLGFGASIYAGVSNSKYDKNENPAQVYPPSEQVQIEWLTAEQLAKALKANANQIENVLKTYSSTTKKMSKIFRSQLENRLAEILEVGNMNRGKYE